MGQSLATACISLVLLLASAPALPGAGWGFKHKGGTYAEVRDVVDRTQSDLRNAADLNSQRGDDRDRYKNAQGHLSTFDRKLIKGNFDKGELEKALGDLKNILDKNVLQGSTRDSLMRDVTDLKIARDRVGE